MLHSDQSDDELFQAFIKRDQLYDGHVYAGVKTTGIYCKFSCSARKPKRENVEFFMTKGAAIAAGYRACKLCKPEGLQPKFTKLIKALHLEPGRIWREHDLLDEGYDPRTLRRNFSTEYGITFSQMARQIRMGGAIRALEKGARVIDAQHLAGFNSAQGFRTAFAELVGVTPVRLTHKGATYQVSWIETPLGAMISICDQATLHLLEFVDRKRLRHIVQGFYEKVNGDLSFGRTNLHKTLERELNEYFSGKRAKFTTPVKLHAQGFTRRVWSSLMQIPAGETRYYIELARETGNAKAFRAVANANARNQIAIVVPCHRVISANGQLAGYAGGVWRKEKLIEIEKQYQ